MPKEVNIDKKNAVDDFLNADEGTDTDEHDNTQMEPIVESDAKRLLRKQVIAALKTVHDPEIPENIYDLGLIYNIAISDDNFVKIDLTLTAPGCPVAHLFPSMVKGAVTSVEDVSDAEVELVWDPPWTQDRMSEAAKLELGMF